MSLIDEALKKARLEAAQRDAERRGLPSPAATTGLAGRPAWRRSRRLGGPLAAGIAIGALAVTLAVGAGFYLGRVRTDPPVLSGERTDEGAAAIEAATAARRSGPAEPAASDGEPAGPAVGAHVETAGAPEPPAVREGPPATTAAGGGKPSTPASGSAPGAETAKGVPAQDRVDSGAGEPPPVPAAAAATGAGSMPAPSADLAAGSRPAAGAASSAGPDTAADEIETGTVYSRRAPLPGGGELVLSGIAWRETDPVAVINGEILGVGEGIAGYKLVAVARDRVDLRGPDGAFTIRLP